MERKSGEIKINERIIRSKINATEFSPLHKKGYDRIYIIFLLVSSHLFCRGIKSA